MNCRIGKLGLLVVMITLASNAVAAVESSLRDSKPVTVSNVVTAFENHQEAYKSLTNLFSGMGEPSIKSRCMRSWVAAENGVEYAVECAIEHKVPSIIAVIVVLGGWVCMYQDAASNL